MLGQLNASSSFALAAFVILGGPGASTAISVPFEEPSLRDAQRHFYNARYEAAAALTLDLRGSHPQDLANDELRTSALLFQLKGLLERPADKQIDRKEADKKEAL